LDNQSTGAGAPRVCRRTCSGQGKRIVLRHVAFPGKAGVWQRAGRLDQLELAGDYARYHEYLASQLEALGSERPDPAAFGDRVDDYADACNAILALLSAESLLRNLAQARGSAFPAGVPLVDERHRLVSGGRPRRGGSPGPERQCRPRPVGRPRGAGEPARQSTMRFRGAIAVVALFVALSGTASASPPGLAKPQLLRSAGQTTGVGIDAEQRIYLLSAAGQVTVVANDGRPLASWSAGSGLGLLAGMLPSGGIVTARWGGGPVVRWTWDGRPQSQWTLPPRAGALARRDPRGSLLILDPDAVGRDHLKRYSLDGAFLGYVPGGAGIGTVVPDGRAWVAHGGEVDGFEPDGIFIARLGHDCPIGGDTGPCSPGTFQPSGRPLSLAATPGGGVLVTVVRAGTTGAYTTRVVNRAPAACRSPGTRIQRLRHRGRQLRFMLTRRGRVRVTLQRIRRLDCAAPGLAPSRPGCAELTGKRIVHKRTAARGMDSVSLPVLGPGTWLATVTAGRDAIARVRIRRPTRKRGSRAQSQSYAGPPAPDGGPGRALRVLPSTLITRSSYRGSRPSSRRSLRWTGSQRAGTTSPGSGARQ
jgi:hypothetical protein